MCNSLKDEYYNSCAGLLHRAVSIYWCLKSYKCIDLFQLRDVYVIGDSRFLVNIVQR